MDKESIKEFERGFLEDIEIWSKTEFKDEDEKNKKLKLIQTKQKLIKDYYDTVTQQFIQEERLNLDKQNAENRYKLEKEKNNLLKKEIELKNKEIDLKDAELKIKSEQVKNDSNRLEFDKKRACTDDKIRVVDMVIEGMGKGIVGGLLYLMFAQTTHAEYKDNVITRPKVREILGNMWKLLI